MRILLALVAILNLGLAHHDEVENEKATVDIPLDPCKPVIKYVIDGIPFEYNCLRDRAVQEGNWRLSIREAVCEENNSTLYNPNQMTGCFVECGPSGAKRFNAPNSTPCKFTPAVPKWGFCYNLKCLSEEEYQKRCPHLKDPYVALTHPPKASDETTEKESSDESAKSDSGAEVSTMTSDSAASSEHNSEESGRSGDNSTSDESAHGESKQSADLKGSEAESDSSNNLSTGSENSEKSGSDGRNDSKSSESKPSSDSENNDNSATSNESEKVDKSSESARNDSRDSDKSEKSDSKSSELVLSDGNDSTNES